MVCRVVIRRSSSEPVRTSGLLHTAVGLGSSVVARSVVVSHAARTNPLIVSIGICSPMP